MKRNIGIMLALLCAASCYSMEEVYQPLLNNESPEQLRKLSKTWSSLLDNYEEIDEDLHMVYNPGCNVSFFGLEKKHPFDSTKYEKIYTFLKKNYPELKFHKPVRPVTNGALSTVHTADYIHSLCLSGFDKFRKAKIQRSRKLIIDISEMEDLGSMKTTIGLCLLYAKLLKPMKLAAQGTLDATILALKNGWSINLAGGFHHAKAEMGSGYCFYADVPIAIQLLHLINPEFKVLIVDLDVHHGDGNEAICGENDKVFILDMFNKNIFADNKPDDEKKVDYMAAIEPGILDAEWLSAQQGKKIDGIEDDEYLEKLEELYTQALDECKPDFIFYNAGTDVYQEDPLGRMNITKDGIKQRD